MATTIVSTQILELLPRSALTTIALKLRLSVQTVRNALNPEINVSNENRIAVLSECHDVFEIHLKDVIATAESLKIFKDLSQKKSEIEAATQNQLKIFGGN